MRLIAIGRIVATHGVRGELKLSYYNDKDEDLLRYRSFFIDDDGRRRKLSPASVRRQNRLFLIKFEGLDSPEEGSPLVDKELFVREQDLAPLEEGEFYEYQLIGLTVVNRRDEKVGMVTEVLHTTANDILAIRGQTELLVPLVEGQVQIDLERGLIRVDEESLA